jgi:hypothetical protein
VGYLEEDTYQISSKYILISTSKSKQINVTDTIFLSPATCIRSKTEFWTYRYDLYLRKIIRYQELFFEVDNIPPFNTAIFFTTASKFDCIHNPVVSTLGVFTIVGYTMCAFSKRSWSSVVSKRSGVLLNPYPLFINLTNDANVQRQ